MTPIYVYSQTREHDLMVAQLWARMDTDAELADLFNEPISLGQMLAGLTERNTTLVYAADAEGIWLAVWFNKFMAGAMVGAYVRPDYRRRPVTFTTFRRVLREGLQTYGTILGVTRHERLLSLHAALGYTVVGRVPAIFPGQQDGWLIARTPTNKEQQQWQHSSEHSEWVEPAQVPAQPQVLEQPVPAPLGLPVRADWPALLAPPQCSAGQAVQAVHCRALEVDSARLPPSTSPAPRPVAGAS